MSLQHQETVERAMEFESVCSGEVDLKGVARLSMRALMGVHARLRALWDSPPTIRGMYTRVVGALTDAYLARIAARLRRGEIVIDTPNGRRFTIAGDRPGGRARLTIHRWRCLWRLATGGDVGFAESYMAGEWSSPDPAALLRLAAENSVAGDTTLLVRSPRLRLKLGHALNRNTRRGSRRNIAAHYDLGNRFYERWLDAGMTYSSALYSAAGLSLEQAQSAKLDRIVDLLEMRGGERVLEIGCGWGSLAERIVAGHDCSLTGVTLSAEQLAFAQRRLRECGLNDRGDLRLQDYRDVTGLFDRIVAIEMLEAVGEAYWPAFFAKLRASLKPGGVAVLQVITIDDALFEGYRRTPDFIQTYVFPGGMLPTRRLLQRQMAGAGLRLVGLELFGDSYARTVSQWQSRFQAAWPDLRELGFDERFKRMWEYYLAYCQAGFEAGALNVGLYKITPALSTRHVPVKCARRRHDGSTHPARVK